MSASQGNRMYNLNYGELPMTTGKPMTTGTESALIRHMNENHQRPRKEVLTARLANLHDLAGVLLSSLKAEGKETKNNPMVQTLSDIIKEYQKDCGL